MGMRLSEAKARVAVATVAWGEDKAEIGYKPGEVTPALLEAVEEAAEKGDLDVIGTMLEPVLEWWDVLDDDDQRLPTDAATIRQVPLGFLMEVLNEVQEAMRPPDSKA